MRRLRELFSLFWMWLGGDPLPGYEYLLERQLRTMAEERKPQPTAQRSLQRQPPPSQPRHRRLARARRSKSAPHGAHTSSPSTTPAPPIASERLASPPIKGIYLTRRALGQQPFRRHVLNILEHTVCNAVVVDVKDDTGFLSYTLGAPLAEQMNAEAEAIPDLASFLGDLKDGGVYLIGRIAVFRDNLLVEHLPQVAVKVRSEERAWRDADNIGWCDPFREEVWSYNIEIARRASRLGFDEILFDYVQFPRPSEEIRLHYARYAGETSRCEAIAGFLQQAAERLAAVGVKRSATVSGYASWHHSDLLIGQQLELMAQPLDVLCPFLAPSAFASGLPGIRMPVAHPYEVVYQSTHRTLQRLKGTACRVRPWLQDFPDYRFDRRSFGEREVAAQIQAAVDAGAHGWLIWDPRGRYTPSAFNLASDRLEGEAVDLAEDPPEPSSSC